VGQAVREGNRVSPLFHSLPILESLLRRLFSALTEIEVPGSQVRDLGRTSANKSKTILLVAAQSPRQSTCLEAFPGFFDVSRFGIGYAHIAPHSKATNRQVLSVNTPSHSAEGGSAMHRKFDGSLRGTS